MTLLEGQSYLFPLKTILNYTLFPFCFHLQWAALDARAQKMSNKIMRNEIDIDLAAGRHGDILTSQGHGTKRYVINFVTCSSTYRPDL